MAGVRDVGTADRAPVGAGALAALLARTAATGARPGYRALADGVRALLFDGRVPLRARLPAERELAAALGVSRATVTAAYDLLREGGYAHSRRGSGTWTALPEGRRPSRLAAFPADDGVLDLALAAPHAPESELAEAYAEAGGALARHAATSGYHPFGLPELRAALAERFTHRGLPTIPEQILVTTGAQQGVSLSLALLGRQGDRALVENPTYPNALDAVRRAGLRSVPVPVTESGWDVALVESALRRTAPRLAYLIPDFQNPTGCVMPYADRVRLARTARATGTWLLIDETLADLALDVPAPPPFAAAAPAGCGEQILTVGSLSKTHWGGLRVGWVRAGSRLITELAMARVSADLATPVLDQLVALGLLERDAQVLRRRLSQLRAQRAALAAALTERLPDWRWRLPPGGQCLWADLGRPVVTALTEAALRQGVRIEGGTRFGVDPGTHEHRLRLPYTLPAPSIETAVARLAAALDGEPGAGAGGAWSPRRRDWVA
ncbi:PLP-dependent aminotransferase family protein [Streptomyces boncukensis]|uniref:PLP-dependent aminotransferase family protein n=1 Tax=Streptomyces boncukensis TaxID=2711219 RepID=A0A6G4X617_9ACTN|nr:PLP-dependent aminotransferase family protein [Streptomyces boncukensis]NGO72310.1 PLP-dependent aminotransferase family protein [Streptomyces boncukensis]